MITTNQIVAAIRAGNHRCQGIRDHLGGSKSVAYRDLDRALQGAKKAGAIAFRKGTGWVVPEKGEDES